ncbi:MAG: AAA family ATPase [Cetobacterium sp.]
MKNYRLKNYKMIEDYEFDLNKINIVVGENSSGKSSFLRSFQLLKQSMYFSYKKLNTNFKEGIDFGGYYNLLPNGIEKPIVFKIDFDNELKTYGEFKIKGIEWSYKANELNMIKIILEDSLLKVEIDQQKVKSVEFNNIFLKEYENKIIKYVKERCFPVLGEVNSEVMFSRICQIEEIDLNGLMKNDKLLESQTSKVLTTIINNNNKIFLNEKLKFYNILDSNENEKKILEILDNKYKMFKNSEISLMVDNFLEDAGKELNRKLNNVIYTGAIRAVGERYYRIESDYSFDYMINNDVNKKIYKLKENNNLYLFNKFISEYFDFEIEVKTLNLKNSEEVFFYISIIKNQAEENIVDVGAGYSQILPILYACFGKEKNIASTIVIEQPELHLHPKMQSDLIDLILKLSDKNPNLKFIIETHSSLIIDRIGKHIYKKNYKNKDINVFIFNKKEDNLEIKKTEFDERGLLKEWPIRFFSAKELKEWS